MTEGKESHKELWIGLGIIVAIVLGIIIGVAYSSSATQQGGVSSDGTNPSVQTQQPVQAAPQQSVPSQNTAPVVQRLSYYAPMTFPPNIEAQRGSYVNSCTSAGATSNYCNCSFDYLISNYGLIWIIEANANYEASGVIPPQFHSAQRYCSAWNN
jgi:hypothetical protein